MGRFTNHMVGDLPWNSNLMEYGIDLIHNPAADCAGLGRGEQRICKDKTGP